MSEQILTLKAVKAPATFPRKDYPVEISELPNRLLVDSPEQAIGVCFGANTPNADQQRAPWLNKGSFDGSEFSGATLQGYINGRWRSLLPGYDDLLAEAESIATSKAAAENSANVAAMALSTAQAGQAAYADRALVQLRAIQGQEMGMLAALVNLIPNYERFQFGKFSGLFSFPNRITSGSTVYRWGSVYLKYPRQYAGAPFVMIELESDDNTAAFWFNIRPDAAGFEFRATAFELAGGQAAHHTLGFYWLAYGN